MTDRRDPSFSRSVLARIGVTLLNAPLPGLGLIRLGHGREGGLIAAGSLLAYYILAGICYFAPVGSFITIVLVYAFFILIVLFLLLASIIPTWRRSRHARGRQWWSRWYAILLWLVIGATFSFFASGLMRASYRSFYAASVSMEPTLIRNEKILADMRWRTPQIGNIVMVSTPDGPPRIYRVAAVGGQTFAMKLGVPIIDGHSATQTQVGLATISDTKLNGDTGRLMLEQLPGETGSHRILQLPGFPLDEVAPVRIPAGAIYLLGDDRSLAADSRIPLAEEGIGIPPASAIIGRPLYVSWSKDHSRIGQRADH